MACQTFAQEWQPLKNSDIEILRNEEYSFFKKESRVIGINKKYTKDFTNLFLNSDNAFVRISDSCYKIATVFVDDSLNQNLTKFKIEEIVLIVDKKETLSNKNIVIWNLTAFAREPRPCFPSLKIKRTGKSKNLQLIKYDRGYCVM